MIVSRETWSKLDDYAAILRKWNPRINLVAPSTLGNLESRHIADCLQLAELNDVAGGTWMDMGSGGGLPGLVLAIMSPCLSTRFLLVESDQRKCTFLRTVARELELQNVTIHNDRIQTLDPIRADNISARALAPLPKLMPLLVRHLGPGGQAWLMKGKNWRQEVDETRKTWRFTHETIASRTNPGSAILKISGVSNV